MWKYALTIMITVLVTFSLTAGGGLVLMMALQPARIAPAEDDPLALRFPDKPENRQALEKLQQIYGALSDDFYRELGDEELIEAMARGMANEIDDPYTMYLTQEQVERIEESMSGEYSGIGAYVGLNPDGLVEVTDIIEDSPAEEAGLRIGDLFIEVDGEDVSEYRDVNAVAAIVRGLEGTDVDLMLFRPSMNEYVELTVTRRLITTEAVVHRMLTPEIGYVQIRDFAYHSGDQFIAAVQELQHEGAEKIVFDLRNNSGGLAHEVVQMLDFLLPETVIATLEGRKSGREFSESWDSGSDMGVSEDMRFAVLINSMSASASELFAGCLQDYERARIIGEQSVGKGSGTISIDLPDGSAINVTNFLYYLPNGTSIEGEGIVPDEVVELPQEALGLPISRLTPEQDDQLQAAIDYLDPDGHE